MTGATTSGYAIGSPTRRCAATGRELGVGEVYVAALAESAEDGRLARHDFAADAWEAGARPGPRTRLFGFWKSTVPDGSAKPQPTMTEPELLGLFEQLAEADGSADERARAVALRYLLGLTLMRRRVLVAAEAAAGNGAGLRLRLRGKAHEHDEPYEVEDPGDAGVAEAATDLARILRLIDEDDEGAGS